MECLKQGHHVSQWWVELGDKLCCSSFENSLQRLFAVFIVGWVWFKRRVCCSYLQSFFPHTSTLDCLEFTDQIDAYPTGCSSLVVLPCGCCLKLKMCEEFLPPILAPLILPSTIWKACLHWRFLWWSLWFSSSSGKTVSLFCLCLLAFRSCTWRLKAPTNSLFLSLSYRSDSFVSLLVLHLCVFLTPSPLPVT
jgi:hypothetical protein